MGISVYKITNKRTGKFYVGYSQETEKRFKSHLNMLRRGVHHCIHLQRAWNVDGEDAFEFVRIKVFTNVQDAIYEEQAQFDEHFKTGFMYNSVGSNDKSVAIKKAHSKEAIKRSTESRKNSVLFKQASAINRLKAMTPEAQAKRVATWRKNGMRGMTKMSVIARPEFGVGFVVYESINDAARVLNLSAGNIQMCCVGKRPRVGGYLFSYNLPTE